MFKMFFVICINFLEQNFALIKAENSDKNDLTKQFENKNMSGFPE